MRVEYQVRAGSKILGRYASKAMAGRAMGRFLYDHNNLSLTKVIKK